MPKKEYEGNVGPIGGRKSSEFTEKYEFIRDGIMAAEEIMRGTDCTPERVSKVSTARLVIQDSSPSDIRDLLDFALEKSMDDCRKKDECKICEIVKEKQTKKS